MDICGRRVRLRSVDESDLPEIERWYAEAASAVRGGGEFGAQNLYYQVEEARGSGGGDVLAISRLDDPAPIGLLDYRPGRPAEGWLTIGFLALAAGHRGWGYGSEAVRLLEERAIEERIGGRFQAAVDAGNGLGLYFWLRLGYRPTTANERAGCEATPGDCAMVREAVATAA